MKTWKKVFIAALAVLAVGVTIFACLLAQTYYDKYHKVNYWETLSRRVSPNILLVYGYHGMNGFEQLKDIRTGEFTTPELNHIFINEYDVEDSLVVFRTHDRLRGYLNVNTGKIIIHARFDRAWNFSEGLAGVLIDGVVSFIKEDGKPAFEKTFPINYNTNYEDAAFQFHNGLCVMRTMDNKWGFINTQGEWVVKPVYTTISAPKFGYRIVSDGSHYGMISEDGQVVLPIEYDFIRIASNPVGFTIAKDGVAKIIDKDLKTVVPFVHDGLYRLTHAEYNDYSEVEYVTDYWRYEVGNGSGVIDKKGNVIIPAKYYMVRMLNDNLFDVESTFEGEHFLFDTQGRRL